MKTLTRETRKTRSGPPVRPPARNRMNVYTSLPVVILEQIDLSADKMGRSRAREIEYRLRKSFEAEGIFITPPGGNGS